MTEFGNDVTPEILLGARAYGDHFAELMQRIYDARQTYANTCLGSIVCDLKKNLLNPQLNDSLDVAVEVAKLRGTPPTCGLIACGSVIETGPESVYVQPCGEYADGVYTSNLEQGPERPPVASPLAAGLPEEA